LDGGDDDYLQLGCGGRGCELILVCTSSAANSVVPWRMPLECLDLAFLVDAQHQGVIRRVQVQADDVAHLLDEERVVQSLKLVEAMRLQPEDREVAMHGALGQPVGSARLRRDQWVLPLGLLASAVLINSAISSSPVVRGRSGFSRHKGRAERIVRVASRAGGSVCVNFWPSSRDYRTKRPPMFRAKFSSRLLWLAVVV
jgi:hypothetical protein